MPKDALPKEFRSGQVLTSAMLDAIVRELWRLRKMIGVAPLDISNADGAQGDDPPTFWLDLPVIVLPAQTGATTLAAGSPGSPSSVTDAVLLLPNSSDATLAAATSAITVYSTWPVSIPASTQIWVVLFNGYYYLFAASNCSSGD